MPDVLARLRTRIRRAPREAAETRAGAACSWEAMRAVYEEQARRGVPEAKRGLERIEQGRWPTSGRPRERQG
ncbi:MAG: hypothetical protein PVG27_01240 [Chloroflexota bacterium]